MVLIFPITSVSLFMTPIKCNCLFYLFVLTQTRFSTLRPIPPLTFFPPLALFIPLQTPMYSFQETSHLFQFFRFQVETTFRCTAVEGQKTCIYIIYTTWFIVYNIYIYHTYIIKYPTYVCLYTLHVNLTVAVHSCRRDSMQREASTPTGASKSGHEAWFTWPKLKGLEVQVVTTSQHIYIYIFVYIHMFFFIINIFLTFFDLVEVRMFPPIYRL